MSFSGTLILCGVGGLFYKFGDQKYEPIENIPRGISGLTIGFIQKQFVVLKDRISCISCQIGRDFFKDNTYLYPIKGMIEIITQLSYFWNCVSVFIFYTILYCVLAFVYFMTIFPMYVSMCIVLGPFGIVVSWVQMVLHVNTLTMMILRMSQVANPCLKVSLTLNADENILEKKKKSTRYYVPISSFHFWINHVPLKTVEYIFGALYLTILLLISSFPVLGPPLFNVLISPFITRIYLSKYLRLKNLNNLQREERFYKKFGQYMSFGLVAGQLEVFPIISAFTYISNNVAIGVWDPEGSNK